MEIILIDEIKNRIVLSGCFIIKDGKILLLYKKIHNHYETPGGKVEDNESIEKTAERETYEELGTNIRLDKLTYFGKTEFEIPDGRLAVAHKFITKIISGEPKLNEPEVFSKFDYLPINELEKYKISPDLKLLLPKIKDYFKC